MDNNLINSYVDGESTNPRLAAIEARRAQNQLMQENMRQFRNVVAPTEIAYTYNQAPDIDYSKRTMGEAFKDASHLLYNKLQEAEISQSDDIINQSNLDKSDAEFLYDISALPETQFVQKYGINKTEADIQSTQVLNRLRKDGVFTENRNPTQEELQEIINNSNQNIAEAQEKRATDYEQLQNSLNNYDISQYATRKSNEAGYSTGNFLYKTASMFGSSWSDIGWQILSTAGSLAATVGAGALAGASVGATAGSVVPGIGTATGAVSGAISGGARNLFVGLAGVIGGEFAGGIQARRGESHIEAWDRYEQNLEKELQNQGIDKQEIINNARTWLKNNNSEYANASDEDVYLLAANGTIPSGSNAFDNARRIAYRGTRRLYEKNLSLEAGDVATDLLFYVPAFRNSKVLRGIVNPIDGAVTITGSLLKKSKNPFKSLLANRLKTNTDIAKEALSNTSKRTKKLTGKLVAKQSLRNDLKGWGVAKFADIYEEGTEEGYQYIKSNQVGEGAYDDSQVSKNLFDAITNGNLIEDIADSWLTRNRSTLAVYTPFDPIYSNDEELKENYISGQLLSLLDPRSAAFTVRDALNARDNYKVNKQFGDIFQRALEEQDFVDRSVDLLQSARILRKRGSNYSEVLDNVANMLKSGKYDLGAIADTSEGEVTEQDIDDYINEEKEAYNYLLASKKIFSEPAQRLGLNDYDQDVYTAIANNLRYKTDDAQKNYKQSSDDLVSALNELNADDSLSISELSNKLTQTLQKNSIEYNEAQFEDLLKTYKSLANINSQLNAALKFSQRLANQAEAESILKQQGVTAVENAIKLRDLQKSANAEVARLVAAKTNALNDFSGRLNLYGQIQTLENQIEDLNFQIKSRQDFVNNIDDDASVEELAQIDLDRKNIDDLQRQLESSQKRLEQANIQMTDIVNTLSDAEIKDSNLQDLYDRNIADKVELNQLVYESNLFYTGNKSTKDLIKKFKERVLSQSKERDEANAQARGEVTATPEEQKQLTDEQLSSSLDEYNNQLVSFLSEASAVSPTFNTLLNRLQRGLRTITNPAGRVNYTKRSLEKFTKALENIPKGEMTTEDQQLYSNLKGLVESATKVLDEIQSRAADKAFKEQRRKLDITSDPYEWTAPDGKKFKFLPSQTEHSVNEGVILKALDVTDSSDIDTLRKAIKEQDKLLKKLKNNLSKQDITEEDKKENIRQYNEALSHLKNLQQDLDINLQNRVVEFKVSEQGDYLKQFKRKDNQNKELTFENRLNRIKKNSDDILNELLEKRKDTANNDYAYEEPSDEDEGTKNSSPDWLEQQEVERIQKKDKFKAKAYAFTGTKTGVQFKNRLLNPYYQAKEWFGTIYVRPWNDVKEEEFANASITEGKIKWSRPSAYHTFERLLSKCADKNDGEILDVFTKAKQGNISGISKNQYQNMVNALPISTVLFNNRLRTENGVLMPTRLVMPDITSRNRTNELSDYEQSLRENMIMNLVRNTKPGETPKINVAQGNVSIFYSSFLQNTKEIANQQNPILIGEDGSVLSSTQLNDKYDSIITNTSASQQVLEDEELQKILTKLGYDHKLLEGVVNINNQDYSAAAYFIRGAAKFGDGIITADTFISNYLLKVLGKSSLPTRIDRKQVSEQIVDRLMEVCPSVFLSYDKDGGQSLDTTAQVEDALYNHWNIRLPIKIDGKVLRLTSLTREEIVNIGEQIEDDIKSLNSREAFIESLKTRGLQFSKDTAKVLADYFMFRKFNKLLNPSNIINVLTSGTAVPVRNELIDTRQKVAQQDLISNVKALGLIFDEDSGKYYYSRDKYRTYVEKLQNEEISEDTLEDNKTAEQNAIEQSAENMLNRINLKLKPAVEQIQLAYNTTWEDIITQYKLAHPNETVSKRLSKNVATWFVNDQKQKQLAELEHQYNLEQEDIDDATISEFEGKDVEPVTLGYATANGTILRYDTYTKRLTPMAHATGSAGSIYLILPSFFNSNRNRIPVKLNPQKININVARVIANLMYNMASGAINADQSLTSDMVQGLHVTSPITVGQFVNQLMYYGTDAIERNPSNQNLQKLCYIQNNKVYYGNTLDGKGSEVTPQTIEDFAQWISQNKNYRVDKDLLGSDDITITGSYTITDQDGNVVLSQEHGENYIANLINAGKLMTDMDTSVSSTIFGGNPQVYMDYTDHFKDIKAETKSAPTKEQTEEAKKDVKKGLGKIKAAKGKPSFISEIMAYLNSFRVQESIELDVNGKRYKVGVDSQGYANDFNDMQIGIADTKGDITVTVYVDGDKDKIFTYRKANQSSTSSEPSKPATTPKTEPKTPSTKNESNSSDLSELNEIEDEDQAKEIIEAYYDKHKTQLQKQGYKTKKSFVDEKYNAWLMEGDVDGDLEDLEDTEPVGKPGSGLTQPVEKTKTQPTNLPPMNLGAAAGGVKTPTSAQQPSTDRTLDDMLTDIGEDTIAYLIASSSDYNPSASPSERIATLEKAYLQLAINKFGKQGGAMLYMQNRNKIGEYLRKYDDSIKGLHDSIKKFFKNFVRMEDYTKAMDRVKKILGENFSFDVYTELPLAYDKNKNALVYVYGACTANGIRLFRDARKNKIKRGSAYHEAFHRVSMLLMTPAERNRMYENLYKIKPEMRKATERQKQEYLADMFADFVLQQVSNESPLFKFLNSIWSKIRKLIDRLKNGVNGIEGRAKLHSLFSDMYQGKYAYLEASRENEEYFRLAFEYDPLYSSFKYNGVDIAKSAQQFNDIYRNIVADLIFNSGLLSHENGQVELDYKALRKLYENRLNEAKQVTEAAINTGDTETLMKAINHQTVLEGIVRNWNSWQKYIKQQARLQFSLETIDDPNIVDFSDMNVGPETEIADSNSVGSISQTIANDDTIKASYMRNQYKSLDSDVRLAFYGITENGELTEDGLYKYANVYQLWHELCTICQEAKNVDDMIEIIRRQALANKGTTMGNTLKQVVDLLKDENTSEYIKNKIFSNVIKYTNTFVITNFRKTKDGKLEVSIEDSNQEKSQSSTKKQWQNAINNLVNALRFEFTVENYGSSEKRNNAIRLWFTKNVRLKDISDFNEFTNSLRNLGIEISDIDVISFLHAANATDKKTATALTSNFNGKVLPAIQNAVINVNKEISISKTISNLFNPTGDIKDNVLLRMSEYLSTQGIGSAKNDTVRIAKGAVAYIIGQYNHITRFFNRLIKEKSFRDRFDKNAYTKVYKDGKSIKYYGSKWAEYIKKNKPVLYTLASTVYDSDYSSGNDFMSITPLEDMLNKFSATLQGLHNIPELANKKTYYVIGNMPMEQLPITMFGNHHMVLNESAIQTFRGYLLSELFTIREAMQTRDEFVNRVNKIMGTKYTYKTLSELSQEQQEELFKNPKIGKYLGALRLKYHYDKAESTTIINSDGSKTVRNFGINLTKGAAYKSRHFQRIVGAFNITSNTTDADIFKFVKSSDVDKQISQMVIENIQQVIDFMKSNGILQDTVNDELKNNLLPENAIFDNPDLKNFLSSDKVLTTDDYLKAIAYFTVNNMVDVIEFEKIVSGDIAEYGSDMDSVNKRYSAQTSTTSIKNDRGTIRNEFIEDELYDSPTYRSIEINTNKIDLINKYRKEAKRFLGVDAFDMNKNRTEKNPLDYRKLLDANGNFTKEALRGTLVKRYLDHVKYGRGKYAEMTNEQLAEAIVNNCNERLELFRTVDPTDAQTWILADLNRQFKQREGLWTTRDEACHNLLEHYDELEVLQNNPTAYENLLKILNIDKKELENNYNLYKNNKMSEDDYAGYILGKTPGFIQGSLKYIFFGTAQSDNFFDFGDLRDTIFYMYDKTSLSPIYKIFTKGHDMEKVYNLMKQNKVHMIKMESCTKVGNIPSFQLYDKDGNIDEAAFNASPKQDQLFEHIGRQLNTDPHESLTSTLLTQFMKVALTNVSPSNNYKVGKTTIKGTKLLPLYKQVLDMLTERGFNKFCNKFGIVEEADGQITVDKTKFIQVLQDMATQQGASSDLIDALNIEDDDFAIHPSALPNINWVQSKIISAMDKEIIKTSIPGKPMFQVASAGYDNILNGKASADKTLTSYDEDGYMQVKLSISLFNDVLKQAGLQNASFKEQRSFILNNKDILMSLAYRVPTQGQNSTLPIKIVDVFEPQRGDIIMFPADITALTGSDFDIDKMFLARYNIEVVNGKARRISYDINNLQDNTNEQLQNLLLDMYFSVLTSMDHRVDTVTPLDVTTNPLRDIKGKLDSAKGLSDDSRKYIPGWWLNPVFQAEQRSKNASSSLGIGPMALNNVFRFFLQMSGLNMRDDAYLNKLGLSLFDKNGQPRIYDRDGESILDSTSALINAHVDAVKDNYIGRMNVNTYTFDVVSTLISNGFGNSTYWFLGQQGIVDVANNYINLKTGNIVADEEMSRGNKFMQKIIDDYRERITDAELTAKSYEPASPEEMTEEFLQKNVKPNYNSQEWLCQQLRYINAFNYMKQVGEDYRKALAAAQIDTGKYGISANDIINFMQSHDQFLSEYNVNFMHPELLFDETFLGSKYENGVAALFKIFSTTLLEFSPAYVNTINNVSKQLGIYGPYGKQQMKRFGQRLKTAIQSNFFVGLIRQKYPNTATPLYDIIAGANTVVDQYSSVKERASYTGEGQALFDVLKPALVRTGSPKFFNVDSSVTDDPIVKSNVTQAWRELYESSDETLSNFAKDLSIYMFFISGGADNNVGGLTKTSIFESTPPTLLANLNVGGTTYNQYTTQLMEAFSNSNAVVNQDFVNIALQLNAIFDDKFATDISGKDFAIEKLFGKEDAIIVKKGSNKLSDFTTGTFKRFVKRRNVDGTFEVYELKELQFSKYKGNSYFNPIYYKVSKLGYRNSKNNAYSVRADGYVDANGNVQSYLWGQQNIIKDSSDYDKLSSEQERLRKTLVPFQHTVDFAEIYNSIKSNYKYGEFTLPYGSFAAIDAADIILFVKGGSETPRVLINYAQFKNKQFRVIDENDTTGYSGKVMLMGEASSQEQLNTIIAKLNKKATFIISEEANPIGLQLLTKLHAGQINGIVYSNTTDSGSNTTAVEITKPFEWARYSKNNYEVSSDGDKRFSAFYAQLNDGRYIEDIYQLDIKGNGKAVAKPITDRNNPKKSNIVKTGAFARKVSREQSWQEYKNLWRQYLDENPQLEADLIEKASGKTLTDKYASTEVSQARALAELLNERHPNNTNGITQNLTDNGEKTIKECE